MNIWLLRLFTRLKGIRASFLATIFASFLLVCSQILGQLAVLAPEQLVERDLGTRQAAVSSLTDIPLGEPSQMVKDRVSEQLAQGSATDIIFDLNAADVSVDGLAQVPGFYWEGDFSPESYGERFLVQAGVLPETPGQVCVSGQFREHFDIGQRISLSSGALDLVVTCEVEDRYMQNSPTFLASPGTWDTASGKLSQTEIARLNESASMTVRWNGPQAYEAGVSLYEIFRGADEDFETSFLPIDTRESLLAEEKSFNPSTNNPWFFLLPLILLPLVVSFVTTMNVNRLLNRHFTVFHSIGVSPRAIRRFRFEVPLVVGIIGSLLGWILAVGVTPLLRLIMDAILDHEVGQLVGVPTTLFLILLFTILGTLATQLLGFGFGSLSAKFRLPRWVKSLPRTEVVFVACVLLIGVGIYNAIEVQSVNSLTTSSIAFGLAIVLLLPGLLRVLESVTFSNPAGTLASRNVLQRRGSAGVMVVFGAIALITSAGMTSLTTVEQEFNSNIYANVPAGQARIQIPESIDPAFENELLGELESVVSDDQIVSHHILRGAPDLEDGAVLSFTSAEDIESVLGGITLEEEVKAQLEAGGLLRFKEAPNDTLTLVNEEATHSFPITVVAVEDTAHMRYGGYVLEDPETLSGFLQDSQKIYALVNLSSEQADFIEKLPESMGFEPAWLETHKEPDQYAVPIELLIAALLIAVLLVGILIIYSSISSNALRPLVASLQALGLKKSWLRSVVTIEMLLVAVAPTIIGMLAGFLGVILTNAIFESGGTIAVPWIIPMIILVGVAVGLLFGAVTAFRRLKPAERIQ